MFAFGAFFRAAYPFGAQRATWVSLELFAFGCNPDRVGDRIGYGSADQALITNGSGTISFGDAGISTGKAIAMAIVFG